MHRRVLQVALTGAIAACAACSNSESAARSDDAGDASTEGGGLPCFACEDAGEIDATLGRKVQIQLASCNGTEGCHVTNAGGLTYPPADEFRYIIDVPSTERPELMRVQPGDPARSYVYLKVNGDGGIDGGRMPLGFAWDPRIPRLFFDWIEAGAPPP